MAESDEPYAHCYDCGAGLSARRMTRGVAHVEHADGAGYDRVKVPMCPHCKLKRHGIACSECGQLHRDQEAAYMCCRTPDGRLPGEAPDCKECGRRMERGAWGHGPHGPTVEWAECEACDIGWGRFTGWHVLDEGKEEVADAD